MNGGAPASRGRIAHRALELVALGTDVDLAWETALEEASATGIDVQAVPELRRTSLRYRRRAGELEQLLLEVGDHLPHPEIELKTPDGIIRGTADLVLERSNDLIVIDHKTGVVLQEELPTDSYIQQLQLYAVMAQNQFGKPVGEGLLLSLRDGRVAIDVSEGSLREVERSARSALDAFNEAAPGPQPALPSLKRCKYCPNKARCDGFWDAAEPDWIAEVGVCIQGVLRRAEVAANGLASLMVEQLAGGLATDEGPVHVSDVPESVVSDLAIDDLLSITGLRRHHRTPEILVWGTYGQLAVG